MGPPFARRLNARAERPQPPSAGLPLQCLQRGLQNLYRAALERERKPRSERCARRVGKEIRHGVRLSGDRIAGDECVI
jgi:hypothetical protein